MRTLFLAVLLIYVSFVIAQDNSFNKDRSYKIDSLLNVIENNNADNSTIDELNNSAFELYPVNPDSTILLGNRASSAAAILGYEAGRAKSEYVIGVGHGAKWDSYLALDKFQLSIDIYQENRIQPPGEVYNGIGYNYGKMGLSGLALQYYFKAIRSLNFEQDSVQFFKFKRNIAAVYEELGDFDVALSHIDETISFLIRNNFEHDILDYSYYTRGLIYKGKTDYERAISDFTKSLTIAEKYGRKRRMADAIYEMASVNDLLDNKDRAQVYYHRSLALYEQIDNRAIQSSVLVSLGKFYAGQNDNEVALSYLQKAYNLAIEAGNVKHIGNSLRGLYEYYKNSNQTDAALSYLEELTKVTDKKDSLEVSMTPRLIEMENKIENDYKQLSFENERKEYLLKVRKTQYQYAVWVGVIIAGLLSTVVVTIYRNNVSKNQSNLRLEEVISELQDLNEEQKTLMAVVAHDLRSPLNNIQVLAKSIQKYPQNLSEDEVDIIDQIVASCKLFSGLINRILDFNETEGQHLQIELASQDLRSEINLAVERHEATANEKQIEIVVEGEDEASLALVDLKYIPHVIDNLLSNAIKFSKTTTKVVIGSKAEKDRATIYVKDQGPGISAEDQKRMYGKFTRLSARPTAGEYSSGLGLSIVKKYVDAMGAQIFCYSEVGKGTTFSVVFERG